MGRLKHSGRFWLLWIIFASSITIIIFTGEENNVAKSNRIIWLEDCEDYAAGSELASQGNWGALTDPDGNTTVTLEAITGRGNTIHFDDESTTNASYLDLAVSIPALKTPSATSEFIFSFIYRTNNTRSNNTNMNVYLGDAGAYNRLYLTVHAFNGYHYHNGGTQLVPLGAFSEDTFYEVQISVGATAKYRVRTLTGTFSPWDDNSGSGYAMASAWTGPLSSIRVLGQGVYSCDYNLDDLRLVIPSDGMQFTSWKQNGNDYTSDYPTQCSVLEQAGNSLLFAGNLGLYRAPISDPDNWTLEDSDFDGDISFCDFGSGTVYAMAIGAAIDTSGTVKKTTDYGETWAAIATTDAEAGVSGYHLFNMDDGDLYALCWDESETPVELDIWRFDVSDSTWDLQATYSPTAGDNFGSPLYSHVSGDDFFCFWDNDEGDTVEYLKFDNSANTFTKVATVGSTLSVANYHYHSLIDGTSMYVSLQLTAGPKMVIMKSTDSGATWSQLQDGDLTFVRNDQHTAANKLWCWEVTSGIANTEIYYYDSTLGHFTKIFDIADMIPDAKQLCGISDSGYMIMRNTADDGETWEYIASADDILSTSYNNWATEEVPSMSFTCSPAKHTAFNLRDIVEFTDGFDTTAFKGKIVSKRYNNHRGWYEMVAEGLSRELLVPFNIDHASANNTETKLQDIIDNHCTQLYRSSSIDISGADTWLYTAHLAPAKFINLIRHMERCVFHVDPDGKAWLQDHDALTSTGLRVHEGMSQWKYPAIYNMDEGATRGVASGGYINDGTNHVEVRVVYSGDAAQEVLEDTVIAEYPNDPRLRNYTEVNNLATNMYNIYSQDTTYVQFMQVINQGYLQPGQTISLSWSESDLPTITKADFMILGYSRYDAKNDIYHDLLLTNNIVTPAEFSRFLKVPRDEVTMGLLADGSSTVSSAGTAVIPNPVNKLAYGTFIWRPGEPTGFDFEESAGSTDLSTIGNVADTWYDLDLSSIVPSGARSVSLRVCVQDNAAGSRLFFRKNGQTAEYQVACCISQVANQVVSFNINIGVDSGRIIEFNSKDVTLTSWTSIYIVVNGWYL